MLTPRYFPVTRVTVLFVLSSLMFDSGVARAQQMAHPWRGIAADDARPATGIVHGEPFTNELSPRALSHDGRFVVFMSRAALVASDTNNDWDIYLRDRQTNDLSRVSVAVDGGDANGISSWPSISPDGRYVAFTSAASNLVADDSNALPDNFILDREQQTTVRVNVGPNGEQSLSEAALVSISADGRYAVFTAIFGWAPAPQAWLRDRDTDGNGIFDEPGFTTTTELPAPTPSSTEQLFGFGWMILSGDARFVSFNPVAYTQDWQPLGSRLYVHDRVAGTTTLIGNGSVEPGTVIEAQEPAFSDAGHLVYATNAPNLVADDDDIDMDVFVVNLFTGGHTRLQLTHAGAPTLAEARSPAISSDGRFVTFVGTELTPDSISLRDVYAVDCELGMSYEVSVRPDGARATRVGDYPSITADGSAIAFLAGPDMLVDYWGDDGVFVATALSMSPGAISVSPNGETVSIELNAPANTAWEVRTVDFSAELGLLQVSPPSGVGPGIIEMSLPPNHSGDDREYWVIVGSERVTVRQGSSPEVWWLSPQEGRIAGGTEVTVVGNGFAPDATVTFDGQPATNVVVENTSLIRAVTPPNDMPGSVDVVVRNGNGQTATLEFGFVYLDETTVEVQSVSGVFGGSVQLQGTLRGLNGPISGSLLEFFVSDVRVGRVMTSAAGQATLLLPLGDRSASSYPVRVTFAGNGGALPASGDGTLSVLRAPLTIRANDAAKYYGEVLPTFTASGVGFVNGDTLATLSGTLGFTTSATATSGVGTYAVTPGGLSSPNYAITFVDGTLTISKATTTLTLSSSPNPSKHNQTVELRASVGAVAPGGGTPTGSVEFRQNGVSLGIAKLKDGIATLDVTFHKGTYPISATYSGAANFNGSSGAHTHIAGEPR
jgi:Tol biopolymer transport system component